MRWARHVGVKRPVPDVVPLHSEQMVGDSETIHLVVLSLLLRSGGFRAIDGYIPAKLSAQCLTSPSTLSIVGRHLFLFVRVFLTSEQLPKPRLARALDVIGQRVQTYLANCMFIVQNGREWSRVTRSNTQVNWADFSRLNGDFGN